jgi:3-phosphoinositide dependent protein kinase-1
MNQYHLIQEKKAKYAHIERDALIRLAQPRPMSPTLRTHRRGVSSTSSNGTAKAKPAAHGVTLAARRNSNSNPPPNVLVMGSPSGGVRDRPLPEGHSPRSMPVPLSPLVSTSMRLAKSGDAQTQEFLDERAGTPTFTSRPPSPVKEEPVERSPLSGNLEQDLLHPKARRDSANADSRPRTPRKRRQSTASAASSGGTAPPVIGHPGVIHLYCTFADKTSVCE